VVAAADGLGIPSLSDYGADACRLLAGAARRHAKPLALHASEGTRETMEDILALGPSLLIHLSSAARADLRLVADAGVPVAVCPTSNAFFGLRPPVEALESLGVEWYLGTDNAMLGGIDPVEEARWVLGRFPNLPPDRAWRAITTPPWKVINGLPHDASPGAGVASVRVLPLGAGGGVRWDVPPILLER
jgi:cytosine/adenosine deaminase-related metal-dependent hydrolase